MNDTRQIESPDSLELLRTRCPECGYQVAVAVWCHDPACCNQSPWGFLVEELTSAQARSRNPRVRRPLSASAAALLARPPGPGVARRQPQARVRRPA